MANIVRNLSRPGVFQKLSTVKRWVDQCVCEWAIEGRSYRELSAQDRLARMAENLDRSKSLIDNRPKSKKSGYLPAINPSGEKEIMPKSEVWTRDLKFQCLVQARQISRPARASLSTSASTAVLNCET